ncbi:hypothetical protein BDN67DRAFT_966748 [Paxillus ammoniavirescens]|nr:hypothetical protein BDN67DRAFT_966748 [Paxillus ammoniavirescens]
MQVQLYPTIPIQSSQHHTTTTSDPQRKTRGYNKAYKRHGKGDELDGLPNAVELAVGMQVIITFKFNVETDLDVANASRGVLTGIFLDDRESKYSPMEAEVDLEYPPLYVPVELHLTKAKRLQKDWMRGFYRSLHWNELSTSCMRVTTRL